jgi:hypothetical protein
MRNLERATAVLGAALALAGLSACDRGGGGPPAATPDPSAQTIDVKPAPPTGDPPGTTPVAGSQSDLTKGQSQSQMPLEGQNHNYSSVAPQQSQKSGNGSAPSEGDNAKADAQQQGQQPVKTPRSSQ